MLSSMLASAALITATASVVLEAANPSVTSHTTAGTLDVTASPRWVATSPTGLNDPIESRLIDDCLFGKKWGFPGFGAGAGYSTYGQGQGGDSGYYTSQWQGLSDYPSATPDSYSPASPSASFSVSYITLPRESYTIYQPAVSQEVDVTTLHTTATSIYTIFGHGKPTPITTSYYTSTLTPTTE